MNKEIEEILGIKSLIENENFPIDFEFNKDPSQINPQMLLDENYKYFLLYSKLYDKNIILKNKLQSLVYEKIQLKQYISKLEKRDKMNLTSTPNAEINDIYVNRKRHRRNKNEIIREFTCEHPGCLKSYGSEGSLNQHIKRKHKNIKISYNNKNSNVINRK